MSTKGRYGLRALLEVAMCEERGAVSLNYVAKKQNISKKYLGQLFIRLQGAGLITSMRGPKGGYLLSRTPESISIGNVIQAVEGPITLVNCRENSCNRIEKCVCHIYWEKLEKQIANFLDSNTLFDLCEEAKSRGITCSM